MKPCKQEFVILKTFIIYLILTSYFLLSQYFIRLMSIAKIVQVFEKIMVEFHFESNNYIENYI